MNRGQTVIDTPVRSPKTGCMTNEPILVLGATGKTGRRIVERLQARGVAVRTGSRSSDPPFDWEDRTTWGPALAGAGSVYISYFPDLAVPGAPDAVGALAGQARDAGVRRLVLLSGRGEEEAQKAERVVQDAGLEWTVVRCSWFNQNFSEGYMVEPILSGEVAMPAGDVPEPFVDADDIADVAVAALTEDGHAGQVYELTGPRALTFAQAVGEIAKATGRELSYTRVSMDDYAAVAAEQQVPDDVIWLLRYLFTEVLDGRNVGLAGGVQRALGREPRDFSEYARETAATGVWNG
jgi:uncharacterized protein YbjT (DUF2867 family)